MGGHVPGTPPPRSANGLTLVAPCTHGGRWGPLNVYSGCLMYLVHFHVVINCAETVSGLLVTSLSIFFYQTFNFIESKFYNLCAGTGGLGENNVILLLQFNGKVQI